MNILVIEDHPEIGTYVRQGLAEAGFIVELEATGTAGLCCALAGKHHLIVLDIVLPELDGLSILNAIRRAGIDIPVLLLSALDSTAERVKGLEMGADDYLVKPFAFPELLARVRALLRRRQAMSAKRLHAADLQLDLVTRCVMRGGQRIELTAKEFALLELFVRRQGEVLPRSLIASQIWDMPFESDSNIIEVAVRRLRAKIDDGFDLKLLQTARGMGYVLEVPAPECSCGAKTEA